MVVNIITPMGFFSQDLNSVYIPGCGKWHIPSSENNTGGER